jgi:hypothetical protein
VAPNRSAGPPPRSTSAAPAGPALSERLAAAIAAIDAANVYDPNVVDIGGQPTPLALAEGRAAFEWVQRLREGHGATDALLIGARGHHIRRWESPRDEFSRDRAGYQAWRTRLYEVHADHLAAIMTDAGYPTAEVEAMATIVHKRGIKTDPDAQTYEDAVALAFLEIQFAPFAAKTPRATMIRALQRTWRKMSDAGHAAALTLPLTPALQSLVEQALQSGASERSVD